MERPIVSLQAFQVTALFTNSQKYVQKLKKNPAYKQRQAKLKSILA